MIAIVFVAVFAIGIVCAVVGFIGTGRRWDRSLSHATALLESPELADRGVIKGRLGGRAVTIELTTRGKGSNSEAWTEIRVSHRDVPTKLALRPQTMIEDALVAMSRAVDVRVGDEPLDEAFVLDGAPADAVRRILDDASLRAKLLSLAPVEVDGRDAMIQIAKRGWLADERLQTLLSTVVTLAERLETYSMVEADVRAHAELVALAQARARRLGLRKGILAALVIGFVAAFVVLMWLGASHHQ
jgi:hypothetical protein